jgi:ribosome-binding protein aMBF1 (putative translation factor)
MAAEPSQEDEWPAAPGEFGRAVRAAREAAGLSRKGFADKSRINQDTLRNVETGRHQVSSRVRRSVVLALQRLGMRPPADILEPRGGERR